MVYLHRYQKYQFWYILEGLGIENFNTFNKLLVHYVGIQPYGIVCSYIVYFLSTEIWQP
jgi:hypothetical protein